MLVYNMVPSLLTDGGKFISNSGGKFISNSDSGHEEDGTTDMELDCWYDNYQVVIKVSKLWSDIILDYPLHSTINNDQFQNGWHRPGILKRMINVLGTGEVLDGITDEKLVSLSISSLMLLDIIPHLLSKSMVVHCSLRDYEVLGLVSLPILISYTPKESYYHSLICHLYSHHLKLGSIVHVYADTGFGQSFGQPFGQPFGQSFGQLVTTTELNKLLATKLNFTSPRQALYALFTLLNQDIFSINNSVNETSIGIVGQPRVKVKLLINDPRYIQDLISIIPPTTKELIVEDPSFGSGFLYKLLLSHLYLSNCQLSIHKRLPTPMALNSLTIYDQPQLSLKLVNQLNELFSEVYWKSDENFQRINRSQIIINNQSIVLLTEVGLPFLTTPLPDIIVFIDSKEWKLSKHLEPILNQVQWYQFNYQQLPEFSPELVTLGVLVHLIPEWYPILVNYIAEDVDQLLEKIQSNIKTTPPTIQSNIKPTPPTIQSNIKPIHQVTSIEFNPYQNYHSNIVPDADTLLKWHCLFKSAYDTKLINRPDLDSTNVSLQVTVNRRLTPLDYDRNIFHLEFDTQLNYNIGDALGVYGVNHSKSVLEFLQFYHVQPDQVFNFSREDHTIYSNTAFHILSHILDMFGKPTTGFYTWLAEFTSDTNERTRLQNFGQDVTLFRQQVEDSVTFADILLDHPSAHPDFQLLIENIPNIVPRHYSIASSQRAHPNSVHLLVVQVTWDSSRGTRYGQCTRYLANLKPGTWITATIKPSVMHLPIHNTTPIIMAGLGTGLAPFRAFIQDRLVSLANNQPIGPMILYLGARSRASEYLYGEEWDEIPQLTRRCAFSRDQPHKVYIQHLMEEDKSTLQSLILDHGGHFYLCGPTWPEPAVKATLLSAFQSQQRMDLSQAQQHLATLQEEDKYILELY